MASIDPLFAQTSTPHDLSLIEHHSRSLRAQAFADVLQAAGRSFSALWHFPFAAASAQSTTHKPH